MGRDEAARLAELLQLGLDDTAICLACLSFVSMAIDKGDEREIRLWTSRMTPDLWAEGLELPARAALRDATDRGIPRAAAALADVEARGPRSVVAKAIVRHLAEDLSQRARGDLLKMGFQPWPPPELT